MPDAPYRLVFLALLTAACAPALADEPFDEPAAYRARVERLNAPTTTSNEVIYDVLEPVPGAPEWSPWPIREGADRTIDSRALDAARDYAAKMNSNALLIWRDGALELEAYFGGHTRESNTVSRSLAKPMTTIAVGRAIALGKIRSLDQPLVDFFPEWQGTDKAKMRVRHLLDMRSGLLAQGPVSDPASIWTRSYMGTRHDEVILREYPLTDTPGARYNYSNATSDLVAPLIERATGRRYAEFLSQEVLQPLGAPGGQVWVNRPGGMAHSGCCLLIPADAWLRLAVLMLDDGVWGRRRLLPEGYVADVTSPTPQYPWAAAGVYVAGRYIERRGAAHPDVPAPKTLHSEPYLAGDLYLFDGNANQVVYIVPSLRMIILRTGSNPPRGSEWDNAFLPNTLIRGARLRPGERAPEPQPR
jgi:CubicO group peptidase (beta-lactamase class C family)